MPNSDNLFSQKTNKVLPFETLDSSFILNYLIITSIIYSGTPDNIFIKGCWKWCSEKSWNDPDVLRNKFSQCLVEYQQFSYAIKLGFRGPMIRLMAFADITNRTYLLKIIQSSDTKSCEPWEWQYKFFVFPEYLNFAFVPFQNMRLCSYVTLPFKHNLSQNSQRPWMV